MSNFLRQIGLIAFMIGMISIVLKYTKYETGAFELIYLWGDVIAWKIRIGLIGIGIVLFGLGFLLKKELLEDPDPSDDNAPPPEKDAPRFFIKDGNIFSK